MTLTGLAAQYLPAIEDEMRRVVGAGPAALSDYYQMLAYHLGWTDGASTGKRIRPLLATLCCAAAGGDWQHALPLAAALELLHNFSLIHDDIQDNKHQSIKIIAKIKPDLALADSFHTAFECGVFNRIGFMGGKAG